MGFFFEFLDFWGFFFLNSLFLIFFSDFLKNCIFLGSATQTLENFTGEPSLGRLCMGSFMCKIFENERFPSFQVLFSSFPIILSTFEKRNLFFSDFSKI